MILKVNIENRIAKLQVDDAHIVCGNSGDSIVFAFDSEWDAYPNRTARFKWNGGYHDIEFMGNTVKIPAITNTRKFSVGVYSGEPAGGEEAISTTDVLIPSLLCTRCGNAPASNGTGENYTNEARGYAESAKASADATADAFEAVVGAEVQAHQAYYDTLVDMKNLGNSVLIVKEGTDSTSTVTGSVREAAAVALPNGLSCIAASFITEGSVVQIKIPPSVISIESGAFADTTALKRVDFASGGKLQRIEGGAFDGTLVGEFKIPKSVTFIGRNAFATSLNPIEDEDGFLMTLNPVVDLTAFGKDTPFPTAGGLVCGDREATIRIPKGRKAELLAMTNWSSGDYTIEEVEV